MVFDIVTAGYEVVEAHIVRLRTRYICAVLAVILLSPVFILLFTTPRAFPVDSVVIIPAGSSVTQAGMILASHDVVYFPFVFRVALILEGHTGVKSGAYYFSKKENVWRVASRVHSGETQNSAMRVTFPEGITRYTMAQTLSQRIPGFSVDGFMTATRNDEGYLFPDTYSISLDEPTADIIATMKNNYIAHRDWYGSEVIQSVSEKDAVILASILEGEANTTEDRKIVAGILLKRLRTGMRLQVDAPFGYERQLTGYVPTKADIETATPYNTYRNKGLPPTPINNPGYDALYAATHPTETPSVYYLTGTDGKMHYAKTFAEHVANQKKYFK